MTTNFQPITTFVMFDIDNSKTYYHNGKVGERITFNGRSHMYMSFLYQGAAKNRNGNNLEASFVLSANQISLNEVQFGVRRKAKVQVTTCLMDDSFTSVVRELTMESWLAASLTYDTESIEIILSSAIDAVGLITPNRVLTSDVVGALPVTGSIFNR